METFFMENAQVQEWVDLLIEKLFTVCLLSGADADSEFYRGQEAAGKIASIFKEMVNLPPDSLKDAIEQLIEQRLPDSRVMNNFPQFHQLLEDMISTGFSSSQQALPLHPSSQTCSPFGAPSSKIVLTRSRTGEISNSLYIAEPATNASQNSNHVIPTLSNASLDSSHPKDSTGNQEENEILSALAPITIETGIEQTTKPSINKQTPQEQTVASHIAESLPKTNINEELAEVVDVAAVDAAQGVGEEDVEVASLSVAKVKPETGTAAISEADSQLKAFKQTEPILDFMLEPVLEPLLKPVSKPEPVVSVLSSNVVSDPTERTLSVGKESSPLVTKNAPPPSDGERLALVLKQIFPESHPKWNTKINQFSIYVQIADLLIYVYQQLEEQASSIVKKELQEQGWHVLLCPKEDLAYPRRLEREIRQTLRESIHSTPSTRFFR